MSFPNEIEIPEASNADEQALGEALSSRRPLIVRGMASSWPALQHWTKQNLLERLGKLVLPVMEGVSGTFPDPSGMRTRKVRFSNYLENLWSGEMEMLALLQGDAACIYAGDSGRVENFAQLEDDIEIPAFIDRDDLHQIGFWLSCRGVSSWLHYDNSLMDNINAQVRGSKQVTLFSPDDAPRLYLNSYTVEGANKAQFSKVDLREPDVERFPEIRNVQAWVGTLHQGDVVFIPSCWLHGFGHLGEINLNVNFWWKPPSIPWNMVTARKSFWNTVEKTLKAEKGSAKAGQSIDARVQELPATARSMIEKLERNLLSPMASGSYP